MKELSHKQIEAFLLQVIKKKDIYTIAAQFLLAAVVYLEKWEDWVDLKEECKKEPWLYHLTDNLMTLLNRMYENDTRKITVKRYENSPDGQSDSTDKDEVF